MLDAPKLEFQAVVSHPIRVLEFELGSFARALYALSYSTVSPAPVFLIIHPNFNFPESNLVSGCNIFSIFKNIHSGLSWFFWNNLTLIPMKIKYLEHQNVNSGELAGNFCLGDLAEDLMINILLYN